MSTVEVEIAELEERLRKAELGPDPAFFGEFLDDNLLIVTEDGQPFAAKSKILEAHQPGKAPKFTEVQMSDTKIVNHGSAAVVTCQGTFKSPNSTAVLRFMRVWVKKPDGWKIVAGSVSK